MGGTNKKLLKTLEKLKKLPIVEKTLPLVIVQVHLHFTIGLKKIKIKKKNRTGGTLDLLQ